MQSNSGYIEELDFHKYLLVIQRRWKPAMATFAAVVAFVSLLAISRKPTYEAKGQILIQSDKASKLVGIDNQIGTLNALNYQTNPLSTEASILQSRPIVEETIQELQIKSKQSKLSALLDVFGSQEKADKLMTPEDFWKNLNVKQVKGTDILEVTYQDENPHLAANAVNKLAKEYKEKNTSDNRTEAAAVRKFIVEQVPYLESNVNKAEANLLDFKSKNKLANLSGETNNIISIIESLERQIYQETVELKDLETRSQALRNQLGLNLEEAKLSIALSQSKGVGRTLQELQEVRLQLAGNKDLFSERAPQIIRLKEKETELNRLLQEQVKKTLGSSNSISLKNVNLLNFGNLKQDQITQFVNTEVNKQGRISRLDVLKNNLNIYKQRLETRPQLERKQRELERQLEAAQSTYQTLLKKLQETQVAENQNVGNARIVAVAAVPDKPTKTFKTVIVGAGLVTGACLGILVAFILDLVDRSVKNSEEAENIFAYPIHAVIPQLKSSYKRLESVPEIQQGSGSLATMEQILNLSAIEAYQILRTNLKTIDSSKSTKVIVISSSVAQEGKSEVAANLAASMAEVGKKVLLVDGDMRIPTQHERWNLSNRVGLSNVLMKETTWQECKQEVMPNLDVLTAGKILSNPVTLIDSPKMNELVREFSDRYDYTIFDTPPLVGTADTTILGKITDGILLVARPGLLDYNNALDAKKLLHKTNQNVVGMVINGAEAKAHLYRGYQYTGERQKAKETKLLSS